MAVKASRSKTVFFAGHRELPQDIEPLVKVLEDEVVYLIDKGYRYFGAGGATGFDTLAAQAVLKLREIYPHIRLILVIPHRAQAKRWSKKNIAVYEDIKKRADKVVYISDEFTKDCVYKRNKKFIEGSSVCVCYLAKEGSGTEMTAHSASREGLTVINLAKKL